MRYKCSTSQISTVESFSSISYLEGYLENADYLPSELQYYVTHYRELACQMKEVAADIVKYHEAVLKSNDASQKKQAVLQIQRCLIRQNELGDQKLDILATMGDLIENKVREIEIDDHIVDVPSQPNIVNLVREEEIVTTENHSKTSADVPTSLNTRSSNNHGSKVEEKPDTIKRKRHGRHRSSTQQEQICAREEEKKEEEERPKKKKARKDKVVERCVKIIGNIDPNEPVYCSCREVSYGEMIGCDNDNCAIEWFHFRCVDLTHKPKGKWFCPTCRGDRQNVMNPELVEQQRKAKKNASSAASGTCGD